MLNIIFGIIPEAIFFSLFIIFTKKYNHKIKNLVFTILMILGYIILKQLLPKNVYCQIIYILYVPLLMFLLYRNKFHISDIFVMSWASILMTLLQVIFLPLIYLFGKDSYMVMWILNRIITFALLILFRNKFNKIYKYFISQWNRNRENPNKIKSLTIRNICVISLNISIFILNLCMILISN